MGRFIEDYENLTKNNVRPENNPFIVNATTSEPIEVFASLGDCIHSAVLIYDRLIKANINSEDKEFMGGIKHIDNIIKHNKEIDTFFS